MGHRGRHFCALMKKNWISTKRTPIASICELLCPVALMVILSLARLAVKKYDYAESSQISTSAIYHPLAPVNLTQVLMQIKMNPQNTEQILNNVIGDQELMGFYNFSTLQTNVSPPFMFLPTACNKDSENPARTIIAYSPNNSISQQVVAEIQNLLLIQRTAMQIMASNSSSQMSKFMNASSLLNFTFQGFESGQDISNYLEDPLYMMDDQHTGICFGFDLVSDSPDSYKAKFYFNDALRETKEQNIPNQLSGSYSNISNTQDNTSSIKYFYGGFSHLQNIVANTVLRRALNSSSASIAMTLVPFKTPYYVKDDFSRVISSMLPFFMLIMYILPIRRILQRIVAEKETKIRESMRMMGLDDTSYWLSWFVYYLIIVTIISILCLIILSINVVKFTNKFVLFLYLWIYGLAQFGYIVFIQCFFSKQRIAQIGGTLIYFGTSFVDQAVKDPNTQQSSKVGASVLSTVAVTEGANVMGAYEISQIGTNFQNINDVYQNYTFANCLVMMSISFGVFLILGLYLDNVLPSTFGRRKPWYFCISPNYWRGHKKTKIQHKTNISQEDEIDGPNGFELKYLKADNYEPPANELLKQEADQKILRIQDLRKVFSNGFEAVKGVNVKMFNGQIFALLGHNGAGKTTTISMLTGLIQQTSGTASVFGFDMFNEMEKIRTFLGVCPQHDVLFDLLTPLEHLQIFCDFKGVDKSIKDAECEKMIKDADLTSSRDMLAHNLSGGGRRKLSVAIALVGGSKLVLLDEPTSGMDLTARRRLWNMLKNQKNNRIVILTTHYMDEADILGDRIGIMAEGQLICLGSSLFLKNRFGVGYNLKMVKTNKDKNLKVDQYLKRNLGPECKLISEVSSEITYQIPNLYSERFQQFFERFDREQQQLELNGYGISITTLEEVFLRVGHGENLDDDAGKLHEQFEKDQEQTALLQENDDYSVAENHEVGAFNVFSINLNALFRKRFNMYKRSIKTFIVEVIIPVVLVIIGLAFGKIQFFYSSPPKELSTYYYPKGQSILLNSDLVVQSSYSITPQQFFSTLPNASSFFIPTYNNYSSINTSNGTSSILYKFDDDVFNELQTKGAPYNYGSYLLYDTNNQTKKYYVSSFINLTSQDVSAFFPQYAYESILKQATGNPNFKFEIDISPFPLSQKMKDRQQAGNGLFFSFMIAIAFALIPASIISFVVNERELNLKHMQLISGMNLFAYWISNVIFDIIKAEITMGITIGLTYAFQANYDNVYAVFLMYPVGIVPFTYATSFLFQNDGIAQTATIFSHFVIAGIGSMVVYILRIIESTYTVGDILRWVFTILPSFCLNNSIVFASGKSSLIALRSTDIKKDDFDVTNMGGDLLILGGHAIFWTFVLILIESGAFNCLRTCTCRKGDIPALDEKIELDEDVLAEEQRVASIPPNKMNIRVHKFRKAYTTVMGKPFLAVERSSFGLDYGECFCLIGVNGAGKTTTFKSLTNDIVPTSGEITINGMNVTQEFNKVRKLIGYCPQYDVIFENMTVEEHLDYYARIKGILKEKRQALIEQKIKDLNLSDHRHKTAQTLSGGNKRKLSVAIALIGNPPIIFLDEPSAGMDPQARRFMWSVIAKVSKQQKKSAVVLTTHSMEEVEALSDKLGIFVKGGLFRCFGSCQHIKERFGTGYEIEIKIKRLTDMEIQNRPELRFENMPPLSQSITLAQVAQFMRSKQINEFLVQELRPNGLGNDIYKEALGANGYVQVSNFLTWLHVETNGQKAIQMLLQDFKQVELLEHYNDYFKLRIPRSNKSIGYVFGFIEQNKEDMQISEYSVSQTTLEQIFQRFANVEIDTVKGMSFELSGEGKISIKAPQQYAHQNSLRSNSLKKRSSKEMN